MTDHASAWKPLIDDWILRETRMHPDTPIKGESVRVRDTVEIDDQAFVLLSYDIEYPWPSEEDAPGAQRSANTAVLQAMRVRQPWIEKDATKALGQLSTPNGIVRVYEHLLGARRAYSGTVAGSYNNVTLQYDDGSSSEASVVDGWFLAVVPEARRVESVKCVNGKGTAEEADLLRDDVVEMLSDTRFARTAGRTMYFSPLDLRGVHPLVQWQRAAGVVLVAVCLEQYDEGGVLRLRIDGVRPDDDMFVNWPRVSVTAGGEPLGSAICGEYGLADTITIDVGFRPWLDADVKQLVVRVTGLRGERGPVEPIELELSLSSLRT